MKTKVCTKCKIEKSISEFYKDKYSSDGLTSWCGVCKKQYNKDNAKPIAKWNKQWRKDNAPRIIKKRKQYNKKHVDERMQWQKQYDIENAEQKSKKTKKYNKKNALFESCYKKLEVFEKTRRDLENKDLIEVKCTYCGKWMPPTNLQVKSRLQAFNGTVTGEQRFYCSEACKQACPTYKQIKYWKGQKQENLGTSREVDAWFRQYVLKTDSWTCQKCWKSKDEYPELILHVHHISGVAQEPLLQNDIDNAVTLCIDCHKDVHKNKGCTYFDYRRSGCKSTV